MSVYLAKIILALSVFCVACVVILLLQIDLGLMQVVDLFIPGAGIWLFLLLIFIEVLVCIQIYRTTFCRQSKLVLNKHANDKERQEFLAEMNRRLALNKYIQESDIRPTDPDFTERAMQLLDSLAEKEIRSGGRKVFLGTALSQNGKLDALIVFFLLCRMIWRISHIYNQRPTPREIFSVYSTVLSATFVAFSIEALNIPQTISNSMKTLIPSVTPAMATSSVPFMGSAMHVFTTSLIEGASNCLLAVRAGVITRKAFRYAMYGGEELDRSCIRETGGILLDISQESVGAILKALKNELQELSINSGKAVVDSAGKVADAVVNTAAGAASGVVKVATGTVDAVGTGTQVALGAVADGGKATVNAVVGGVKTVADGVQTVGSVAVNTGKAAVGAVLDGAGTVAGTVVGGIKSGGKRLLNLLPGKDKKD